MKKVLLSFFIFLFVIGLTGCTAKKNDNNGNKKIEEVKETGVKANVGTFTLELTEKGSFDEMHYLYPEGTVVNSLGTYTILVYVKDKKTDEVLFRVPISKYENKTIDNAMGNGFTKVEDKTINDIKWSVYKDNDNKHSYATSFNNTVYVVGFMSQEDMSNFETAFMGTVTFKK